MHVQGLCIFYVKFKSQLGILFLIIILDVYVYGISQFYSLFFGLQLKPYVSQCPREVKTTEATQAAQSDAAN